ncbi:amino acid/amide ABC transporter substrate-binding protein, HAAT family [Methanospirillum hungatei JF-1]|uniref:Amino acid/amide ABC transporter substrate-binding protein, HAAT family n=1 Tax=Methanospirillum hungatei JF-1 (strain ATCC 27890 / DSM 864 / NBRC 100397 / JF-1) TaxID=323259 RepID=Q2FMU2_METHJ|nr:ABC transporter substrate-binding protein [Methanospirillum hungatei]ABD40096.1 amino acid/amide ABC transporter substrate-binding protein, HAAT family [Methanospirillum hungatei JF-1]
MKHWVPYSLVMSIVIIGALLFSGCTEQPASESAESIKIGVVASMSGPASTTGKDIWQSAELAAQEINAQGGVFVKDLNKKIPITLVQGDDESTREGGIKAVSKLITQDNVDLLVGGYSSAVVSAHQSIVADNKVPYIISGGSSTSVSHRDDIDTSYMFFHRPNTDDSAKASILFIDEMVRPEIYKKFNLPDDRPLRLALIFQDSPFGKGQQGAVRNLTQDLNLPIEIVAEETFKMGESDFRTALTSVKAKKPDIIYAVTFLNELIPLTQQARRDVGLDTLILSIENNDDPDYYSGVGALGDYTLMESRFSPYAIPKGSTSERTKKFLEDFQTKYGGFAGMMGAATYESVYIAAKAIENAGTVQKDAVRKALSEISMDHMIEVMKDQVIRFSPDYQESSFDLYVEQMKMDPAVGEIRPHIVWPESIRETGFVIPDWYQPGSP